MSRKSLVVGNCASDHAILSRWIQQNFPSQVVAAHTGSDALGTLCRQSFDLVLVNRRLYADGSDGLDLIRRIKADAKLASTPVMLVSNYSEYQARAVSAGAHPGFGKEDLRAAETLEKLAPFLGRPYDTARQGAKTNSAPQAISTKPTT